MKNRKERLKKKWNPNMQNYIYLVHSVYFNFITIQYRRLWRWFWLEQGRRETVSLCLGKYTSRTHFGKINVSYGKSTSTGRWRLGLPRLLRLSTFRRPHTYSIICYPGYPFFPFDNFKGNSIVCLDSDVWNFLLYSAAAYFQIL